VNAALLVRMVLRQSRGGRGRLVFFAACIAVGVAALVGVGALVDAIEAGLRARSRELLGGDLEVQSRRPLPDVSAHLPARDRELGRVDVTALPTMVQNAAGASRLAEVKAIDVKRGRYPLVGGLVLRPDRPLSELLDERSVVVTPELQRDLGLALGSELRIGGKPFTVRGVIAQQPERLQFSFVFGPELLISRAGLTRAALLGDGSRVRYRSLLAFAEDTDVRALARIKRELLAALPGGGTFVEVETHDEAQPALRDTLERVRRYLGLVALLSLLLGCVGVAQIASTWIAQSAQDTAVLRCLGFRPRDVLAFHLGHVLLIAVLGSAAGSVLGLALPVLASRARPDLIPAPDLLAIAGGALAQGVGLGAFVALLFCVPPLTAIWKVSPALVLRSEAAPLPVPPAVRAVAIALCAAGVFAAAWSQARDALHALAFACGVGALSALLWLGAAGLQRAVGLLPRGRLPVLLWQGAAALVRPGAGTTSSIVALGLGTLVVLAISLVEDILGAEVSAALPADAPSVFLADVQPDQWPGIAQLGARHGAQNVQNAPVVMARLSRIDGRPVSELVRERAQAGGDAQRASWVYTREQRVTWQARLPEHNTIVAGALWRRPGVAELSIEQDYARDLGVGLDSRVMFDVQGVPIEFVVTSLRKVQWRSFSPNFFLVVEPGYLDDAPQFHIAAMRLDAAVEQRVQDELTERYPNVTVIRVRSIIERVSSILDQVALGVRLLGGFAVLTGLVILIGTVAATQLRRAREAALLKTLGVTRARVAAMFAWEYALRGAVAGALGALGAYALAYGFTSQVLELARAPSLALCIAAVLCATVLSVLGGLLASTRALLVPPLLVLRQES
jgi:putative ABC transport system permease protein